MHVTEQSLKMQALGITVTINGFMQNLSIKRLQNEGSKIMAQMLLDERWEGIAFLALYDYKGEVILHSNPALVGEIFKDIKIPKDRNNPFYHRITLGTGEEVFVSDTNIKISQDDYLLRVALHTYPVEMLLRTAETHLIFMIFASFIILISGFIAIFLMGKIEKIQLKMKELESLSMLSRVMAHEIRNPLGSIKGFTQYLMRKLIDPTLRNYLDIILKESLRLERLSNELSNYANPQIIKVSEFNLKELFMEIILSFNNQSDIQFIIDGDDLFLKTDRDKLKQILTNIIQNSIDALTNSLEKKVNIKAKKINGKIKIEILDTGIGMREDTLKRALEAFFTTKPQGTGLGLAIVRKLCESLKIDLKIISQEGRGTIVWLTIPESL